MLKDNSGVFQPMALFPHGWGSKWLIPMNTVVIGPVLSKNNKLDFCLISAATFIGKNITVFLLITNVTVIDHYTSLLQISYFMEYVMESYV